MLALGCGAGPSAVIPPQRCGTGPSRNCLVYKCLRPAV